jgi:hypothetical protein
MKKLLAATIVACSFGASAANFVSVDYDNVIGRSGATNSGATTVRAGKEVSGLQLGMQSRTARFAGGGLANSLEGTVGKDFGGLMPYVGLGHDFGYNGGATQNYGLIGANYGLVAGPGFALAGVKTRVRASASDTKQTVAYATYSIPVVKNISINLNTSYSAQDIKEKALGVGLSFGF